MQIYFLHEHKRYARVFSSSLVANASDLALKRDGWIWGMLKEHGTQSLLRPASTRDLTNMVRCLKVLSNSAAWTTFANLQFGQFTVEELADKFHLCDELLLKAEITKHQIKRWTSCLRQWSLDYLRRLGLPRFDRFRVLFQSRVRYPAHRAKQLISDHADISAAELPPIGASQGTDVKKLRQAMAKRLDHDLNNLSHACEVEFDEFERLSNYVNKAIESVEEITVKQAIAASLREPNAWKAVSALDERELEAAYLTLLIRSYSEPLRSGQYRELRKASTIAENLTKRLQVKASRRLATVALHSQFGSPSTILACAFAIQLKTGWNISSVFSLSESNITWYENEVEIQGIKTKTDDLTPIERMAKDSLAARAIAMLQQRLRKIKELKWVEADEQHLWLSPTFVRNGHSLAYALWSSELAKFQLKHKLPRFSLEQVRSQVLAREVMSESGNIESARRRAGHRSISMTGHYLDQILLHRFNSSINLDFQRCLEKSVEMRLKDSLDILESERTADILYPIGDGSSCSNPSNPPSTDYLTAGVCGGQKCHVGDGCPNRRIVIDNYRLEEVIRTGIFYSQRWRELLARNKFSFKENHLPSFIFNMSLLGILKRGPYRHIVRAVEANLLKEAAACS